MTDANSTENAPQGGVDPAEPPTFLEQVAAALPLHDQALGKLDAARRLHRDRIEKLIARSEALEGALLTLIELVPKLLVDAINGVVLGLTAEGRPMSDESNQMAIDWALERWKVKHYPALCDVIELHGFGDNEMRVPDED